METLQYFENLNTIQQDIVTKAIKATTNSNFKGMVLNMPMGSGKTRTMLITGLNLYNQFLWICSKTLIGSVINEIKSLFHTSIKYEVLHRDYLGSKFDKWIPSPDTRIIITTPETVTRSYKYHNIEEKFIYIDKKITYYRVPKYSFVNQLSIEIDSESEENTTNNPFTGQTGPEILHAHDWEGIVVDESQNYTNCKATNCRAISSLACQHRWLLSGTQIQEPKIERIMGLFLLLNQSTPNNLPDCKNMIKLSTFPGLNAYGLTCPPPIIQTEIIYHDAVYQMTKPEEDCYKLFRAIIDEWEEYYSLQREILQPDDPKLRSIRGHLLSLITYLKLSLICPREALHRLLEKITSIQNLDQLAHQVQDIKDILDEYPKTNHSSRLKKLLNIVQSRPNSQLIIFSSFNISIEQMISYIQEFGSVETQNREIFTVDSSLSLSKRQSILNQFKSQPNGILFLNYQIGSEGINLQHADTVIFTDLHWNHHKHKQAMARIHRQGQLHSQIHIYYILSNTNFEHEMLKKQKQKIDLIEQISHMPLTQQQKFKPDSTSLLEMTHIHQQPTPHNTFWK